MMIQLRIENPRVAGSIPALGTIQCIGESLRRPCKVKAHLRFILRLLCRRRSLGSESMENSAQHELHDRGVHKHPNWLKVLRPFLKFSQHVITAGRTTRKPKIFFIGFNKCGTKTLHHFFRRNGYLSVHSRSWAAKKTHGRSAAQIMKTNMESGAPILRGLGAYEVFSDMIAISDTEIIEANGYFRELHKEYPEAYFVFNDRPLDKWVRSRLNHEGGKHGSFVETFQKALSMSRDEVEAYWRKLYSDHKSQVIEYFGNHPRFMVFNIEADPPDKLVSFLADDFRLDISEWSHRGSARERKEKQDAKRKR
ncbi:sulfotransferase [Aestuariivirga sp.]|uniref:sulfotransferase n=1 Tax=Aestuariivirga sp. TaxID=2650926 RepID=UPI0039E3A812